MGNNPSLQKAGLVYVIAVCPYEGTKVTLVLDTCIPIHSVATGAVIFYHWLNIQDEMIHHCYSLV